MAELANKSYRFPPTRPLRVSYSSIVPEASREGEKARALESVLQRREETDKTGTATIPLKYPIRPKTTKHYLLRRGNILPHTHTGFELSFGDGIWERKVRTRERGKSKSLDKIHVHH